METIFKMPKLTFIVKNPFGVVVITTLFHRVTAKMLELSSGKKMACLSDEASFDALRVKVMRTLISPELVSTSYNVEVPLCCVL